MHDQERGSQGRILVVDQEEWCRAFLSSVIKLLGFEDMHPGEHGARSPGRPGRKQL